MHIIGSLLLTTQRHVASFRSLAPCLVPLAPLKQHRAAAAAFYHVVAAGTAPWQLQRQTATTRTDCRRAAASDASASVPLKPPLKLIIYSKPGCHLCDGLKEKVEALIDRAEFMPCVLTSATLEVR